MSTDGATITLTYDEILDGGNGPATANFQIKVQGERRGVSTATVSGKTVALKLASAITTGQTVTVTYNDPTVGIDDLFAIQDRSGNDADSLIDQDVDEYIRGQRLHGAGIRASSHVERWQVDHADL